MVNIIRTILQGSLAFPLYNHNLSLFIIRSILTKEHIKILQEAVIKQCDFLDGVRDSIINNPANCKFDFTTLPMCPGDMPGKGCFTTAQVKAIKTIYDGVDIGNGNKYRGFPFGGENERGGWITWITGPNEMMMSGGYPSLIAYFGIEIFKYLILQDPNWNYLDYKFSGYEKEIRYAAAYLNATSVDYNGFKNRKGKIIIYHGWSDPALSAAMSRPVYPYPQEAIYNGKGNPNVESSYELKK